MAEQQESPVAEAANPIIGKKTSGATIDNQEFRKLGEERDKLLRELRDGTTSLEDFEKRWKKLNGVQDSETTREQEAIKAAKLNLYEAYVQGKIKRGTLDRELDKLYEEYDAAEPPSKVLPKTPRQARAERIVRRYMWFSAGGGLIPFPVVDFAAVSGIQVLMLRSLCELYGIPFKDEWGKSLISSLAGGGASTLLKAIPGVGTAVGVITGPIFYAASTYAIGKVFIQHFESGETLLTFDPAKMKSYFAEYYREGANLAKG